MSKNEQFTFHRLVRRVQAKGLQGVQQENRGEVSPRLSPQAFKNMVIELVETRYYDCNMTHALEFLQAEQGIEVKYATLWRWCLIGAIDDATSEVPYAEFFLSEDTLSPKAGSSAPGIRSKTV